MGSQRVTHEKYVGGSGALWVSRRLSVVGSEDGGLEGGDVQADLRKFS